MSDTPTQSSDRLNQITPSLSRPSRSGGLQFALPVGFTDAIFAQAHLHPALSTGAVKCSQERLPYATLL